MKITGQFLQKHDVTGLSFGGKRLEIDHQSAIAPGGQKLRYLTPENCASIGAIEEVGNVDPVGPVGIVDHGKNFHPRVFVFQEGHHAIVDRESRFTLDHIEIFVGLVVNSLQTPIPG